MNAMSRQIIIVVPIICSQMSAHTLTSRSNKRIHNTSAKSNQTQQPQQMNKILYAAGVFSCFVVVAAKQKAYAIKGNLCKLL